MPMELTLIPVPGASTKLTFAFRPIEAGVQVMSADEDVAVVGLGIHPFGRHDGITGLEMGAIAARRALASAGIEWGDVDFAAGGSDAAGNADTSVSMLGLTGVPFINVKNGCATGGSALTTAHAMLVSGAAEVALVVGFDKHPARRIQPAPGGLGDRLLVWRDGPDAHHPVLRDEDPALHGRARHLRVDAGESRLQGVRQRRSQPQRVAPSAAQRGGDPRLEDGQQPADPIHVLLSRRGCGGSGAGPRSAHQAADAHAGLPAIGDLPNPAVWIVRGVQPGDPNRFRALGDDRGGRRRVRAGGSRAGRCRYRPGPGHRVRRRGHAPRRDRAVRARRAGGF